MKFPIMRLILQIVIELGYLVVKVKEAPTGNFIIGGGYGSYDGFMVNASVNDKNLFGSGLNLGFSVDHSSKRETYNISLQNPAINDSIYSGSVNLYNKESLIENTDITSKDNYGTRLYVRYLWNT